MPHQTSTRLSVDQLNHEAKQLISQIWGECHPLYGSGSMSCAIYDTAWVSLVFKTVEGEKRWLFPESFGRILETQCSDGSWPGKEVSQIDGILNTMASLLALQRHAAEPLQLQSAGDGIDQRIQNATSWLRSQLSTWSVASTQHVGFEVIVPTLLTLLEKNGLKFEFEGRGDLNKLNAQKLSRFTPELLYGKHRLTALHSLEGFIGKIDFDRVAHHKVAGSMMGSPSSTAAYLMYSSQWDDESEEYLRHVVQKGPGQGTGSVPSAFPSMYFEWTWLLSTMLKAGFSATDLDCPEFSNIIEKLENEYSQNGVIGFAPKFQDDVDDTAKGIMTLNLLGRKLSVDKMIGVFEKENHFQTYMMERDPSFSANCNALLALLHQSSPRIYASQITKVVTFLVESWWHSQEKLLDKWNLSTFYPTLLMVQAFTKTSALIEDGSLEGVLDSQLQSRVNICMFQAAVRTLLTQEDDGSWNNSLEESAYAVLLLSEARFMRPMADLKGQIESTIDRGVSFLETKDKTSASYIWIEKVTYASPVLSASYRLAALRASLGTKGVPVGPELQLKAQKAELLRRTPLFKSTPGWELHASMIEAELFQPLLVARKADVFDRRFMQKDKYFELIPFTWTSCNNRARTFASASFLFDMMLISVLNYQADEFMEATAGLYFQEAFPELRRVVKQSVASIEDVRRGSNGTASNGHLGSNSHSPSNGHSEVNGTNGQTQINGHSETNGVNGHTHTNGHSKLDGHSDTNGSNDHSQRNGHSNLSGGLTANRVSPTNGSENEEHVQATLSNFVSHVLQHKSIAAASTWDRAMLKRELEKFLLAHVEQCEDNQSLSRQQDRSFYTSTDRSFFDWVRTTAATHTSCPYSFVFVSCLLSAAVMRGRECFPTAGQKYLAASTCGHLATMCRMYNDYGSVARDALEDNLNSVNFVEFGNRAENAGERKDKAEEEEQQARKAVLLGLAEYERGCLNRAVEQLEQEMKSSQVAAAEEEEQSKRLMQIFRMFIDVTDLYGQIYVVRDIASRVIRQ